MKTKEREDEFFFDGTSKYSYSLAYCNPLTLFFCLYLSLAAHSHWDEFPLWSLSLTDVVS